MRPPPPALSAPAMDRRRFLLTAASAALLAACGSSGDDDAIEPGGTISEGDLWLQAGFADGLRVPSTLEAGQSARAPFVFFGADGLPAVNDLPSAIDVSLTDPAGTTAQIVVDRHDEGIPTPYYPLIFEARQAGTHSIEVNVNGEPQRVEFAVAEPGTVGLVAPGDPMRPVDTATFADARGYDPVCTRFEPCPFHEVNLTDALVSGRPTALLVATPGFCQTAICGPVVELLIELDPSADMNVVHAEVYTEPERLTEVSDFTTLLGPVVETYAMTFEPSLVVADASGTVTARLDYAFDLTEMEAALATSAS